MFWKKFIYLCNQKNIAPNKVARDLGLSVSAASVWKRGSTPRDTVLAKISDYFGVPISYFKDEANQEIDDNYNNSGNAKIAVDVKSAPELVLGDIEKELLNICSKLDMRRKTALLSRAYELLEE